MTEFGPYLGFGLAIIAAYFAAKRAPSEGKKLDAETGSINIQAQTVIIHDLQDELNRVKSDLIEERSASKAEILSLQRENEHLRSRLDALELQFREKHGVQGIQGIQGIQGVQGIHGNKGDKGDK